MREILVAFFKTGSSIAGNLLLNVVAMKIMAVILGPSGIGLYSLLRQIVDFASKVGDAGTVAVVQGLASRKDRVRDDYLLTTFWIFVLGATLIIVVLLIFAPWVALWVFGHDDEQTINLLRWLALPTALTLASAYLDGVLNSFRAIGLLALLHVLSGAAMALLAYPVSSLVEAGHPIAFIAILSAPPAVVVVFGIRYALKAGWLTPLLRSLRIGIRSNLLRHFFSIAGTLLITGWMSAGVVLAVRALVVQQEGLASAGIFAAAWILSGTYLLLYLDAFSVYYLPTLSQTTDIAERTTLMQHIMRLTTLFTVPLIVSVISLKPLVVEILYSSEFAPSLEIIRWMLIGDYFWAVVWVIDIQMMAYANMKILFWTNFLWHAGFLASTVVALFYFSSMQGIGIGFLITHVIRLAYYLYYSRSRYHFPLTRSTVSPWLLGLALVVGVSWYTWSDTQVDWFAAPLWVGVAASFSWLSLGQNERRDVLRIALRRR